MKLLRLSRHILFVAVTVGAASCISLLGGIGLEAVGEKLLPLVPLIVALPAMSTMVGDYAVIVAAHAADPAERTTTKRTLAKAIAKAMWVNIIGILILSIAIAWHRDYLFTEDFLIKFCAFVVVSMTAVIAGLFGITVLLDKLLEKHKTNPDDILIPVVTSVTNVMMLSLVTLAALFLF